MKEIMIYKILSIYLISSILPLIVVSRQKEILKLEGNYYALMYMCLAPWLNSAFSILLIVFYVHFNLNNFIKSNKTMQIKNIKLLDDLIIHIRKEEVSGHVGMHLEDYYKTKHLTVYQDGTVLLNGVNMKNTLRRRQGKKLFKEIKKVFREQAGYAEEAAIKEQREAIEIFYKELTNK